MTKAIEEAADRGCEMGCDFSYGSIVVLGDSIAQMSFQPGGFASDLIAMASWRLEDYNGKLDVLNRGMGGYTSSQLVAKLHDNPQLPSSGVRLFIVVVGSNDCVTSGPQHVPVEKYKANLRSIASQLRTSHPLAGTIFLTPSVINTEAYAQHETLMNVPSAVRNLRTEANHELYAEACQSVAQELGIPSVNSHAIHSSAMKAGFTPAELFSDGLHFTPKGYSFISNVLFPTMGQCFPGLLCSKVPNGFPSFSRYRQPLSFQMVALATWVDGVVAQVEKAQDGVFGVGNVAVAVA